MRKRMPLVLVISGALLLAALIVAWQQSGSLRGHGRTAESGAVKGKAAPLQRAVLVCALDVGRSRNPAADTDSVLMTFDRAEACANGHTLFDRDATGFTRMAFTGSGRRVSVLHLSSDLTLFERRDFFLERTDFLRLRSARLRQRLAICGRLQAPGGEAAALLALRQTSAAIGPLATRAPDRLMTWTCSAQDLNRPGAQRPAVRTLPGG